MPSVGETGMKNTLIITALLCFCLKGYAQTNSDEKYDSLMELRGRLLELQGETVSISQSILNSNGGDGLEANIVAGASEINVRILYAIDISRIMYFLLDKNNPSAIIFSTVELDRIISRVENITGRIDLFRENNTNAALESILRDARRLNLELKANLDVLLSELP